MMKAAILALLLGAAIVIGLACDDSGGEDTLTLEEYILEVSCLTEEAATTAADYWDPVDVGRAREPHRSDVLSGDACQASRTPTP